MCVLSIILIRVYYVRSLASRNPMIVIQRGKVLFSSIRISPVSSVHPSRCSLTGHEIPPTTRAVREYLQSSKFIQARAVDKLVRDFKPYLVKATPEKLEEAEGEGKDDKSKNKGKAGAKTPKLWCTLTNRVVSQEPV